MKQLLLSIFSLSFAGSSLADISLNVEGNSLEIVDQSIRLSKNIEPTNLSASQKYVNLLKTDSKERNDTRSKKNIIKNSNLYPNFDLGLNSDIPMAEIDKDFANKYSQIVKKEIVDNVILVAQDNTDLKNQSWKLTQTNHLENSQVDSQADSIMNSNPQLNKSLIKEVSIDYITLDSGYLSNNKSDNYSYRLFTTEAKRINSRLFEFGDEKFINDSNKFIRAAYYFTSLTFDFMSNGYHEWGHFSRDRALGGTSSLIYSGNCAPVQCNSVIGYESFFKWAFKDISSFGGNAGMQSIGAIYSGNASSGNAISALVSGGGLNNDSALAEQFDEDHFLSGHTSIFNTAWQYNSRSRIRNYGTGGDISNAVSVYNSTGVTDSLTVNKVQRANSISILSGSNISSLYSLYDYFMNGATAFSSLMVGDFLVPNQTNYFSTRGITRKIQSGYSYAPQTKIVFGLEYVELGQSFTEYNLGVDHKWDTWQAFGKLTISEKGYLNSEISLSKKLSQNLKVGAYIAQWDSRSLLGERNSLKLSANTTNQGGLRISYLY